MKMLDSRGGGGGGGYGPDDPGPLDNRGSYSQQQPRAPQQQPARDRQPSPPPADDPDDFEDDIPF